MGKRKAGKLDRAEFGERMRLARHRAGLSQADVAAACKVKLLSCHRWENGHALPQTPEMRELLALVLGVDVKWLTTGEDAGADALERECRRLPKSARRYALAMLRALVEEGQRGELVGQVTPGVQLNASIVSGQPAPVLPKPPAPAGGEPV